MDPVSAGSIRHHRDRLIFRCPLSYNQNFYFYIVIILSNFGDPPHKRVLEFSDPPTDLLVPTAVVNAHSLKRKSYDQWSFLEPAHLILHFTPNSDKVGIPVNVIRSR